MNDVTNKYINMIEAFECDFSLASDSLSHFNLCELQNLIDEGNEQIFNDISLLQELSFNLRHNRLKICRGRK